MAGVFVDTSAWMAAIEQDEPEHARVGEVLNTTPGRLYTSNVVLDEVVTLCRMRHGHRQAVALGTHLRSSPEVRLLRVGAEDEARAWALFVDRSDESYSFTDCTSFVLMRRLGMQHAVTLDADFAREGFQVLP